MLNTPTLDKIKAVHEESQSIGEFLEWLTQDHWICDYDKDAGTFFPTYSGIEQLLAEYFDIDLDQAEKERQALLDELRNMYAQ